MSRFDQRAAWERLGLHPERLTVERRHELLRAVASRSRRSAHGGWSRLRETVWPIAQTAAAAALAWLIAHELLEHPSPFFAPVAAIVAMAATRGQRARGAIEMMLGVALGVGIADLLVGVIGAGVGQLALIVTLAMAAAVFVSSGGMLVTEAGVSAALVVAIEPTTRGFPPTRFIDVLTGGLFALLFSQLLFPVHPVRVVCEAAESVLAELSHTLNDVARAIELRDLDLAEQTLLRARRVSDDWSEFDHAVAAGREAARFAPRRRGLQRSFADYQDVELPLGLLVRDIQVLARAAVRALTIGDTLPTPLVEALRELARALAALAHRLEGSGRDEELRAVALRAATLATAIVPADQNISVGVLVGYTQATAADLLRTTGLEREHAHHLVGAAAAATKENGPDRAE